MSPQPPYSLALTVCEPYLTALLNGTKTLELRGSHPRPLVTQVQEIPKGGRIYSFITTHGRLPDFLFFLRGHRCYGYAHVTGCIGFRKDTPRAEADDFAHTHAGEIAATPDFIRRYLLSHPHPIAYRIGSVRAFAEPVPCRLAPTSWCYADPELLSLISATPRQQ